MKDSVSDYRLSLPTRGYDGIHPHRLKSLHPQAVALAVAGLLHVVSIVITFGAAPGVRAGLSAPPARPGCGCFLCTIDSDLDCGARFANRCAAHLKWKKTLLSKRWCLFMAPVVNGGHFSITYLVIAVISVIGVAPSQYQACATKNWKSTTDGDGPRHVRCNPLSGNRHYSVFPSSSPEGF